MSRLPILTAILFTLLTLHSPVVGGSLSNIRKNVRGTNSAPAPKHDDDDHDHKKQKKSRSRRSGHSHSPYLGLSFANAHRRCRPPVEHHVVHVYEAATPTATPSPVASSAVSQPIDYQLEPAYPPPSSPDQSDVRVFDPTFMEAWSVRLTGIYGSDFNDLNNAGMNLLVQAPGSLGLDTSATTYRESWDDRRDNLWFGDVNLVYEAFHSDVLRARFGIGITWMADSIGAEAGLNLTAGFDYQLLPRVMLTGEADIGNLGEADFWHGQIGLGYQLKHTEFVVGIDHYNVGGEDIHGVFGGLRFRF